MSVCLSHCSHLKYCPDVERPDDRAALQVLDGRYADHHGHPEGEAGGRGRIQGRPHQRARHRRARVQHLHHRSQIPSPKVIKTSREQRSINFSYRYSMLSLSHMYLRSSLSLFVCPVIYDWDMGQLKG
jgi:hypothetical protein